jgi:hypothetical protein
MVEWSKDLYVNPNLQANLGENTPSPFAERDHCTVNVSHSEAYT